MAQNLSDLKYSKDWTRPFIANWCSSLHTYQDAPARYLEIGVFEGRSGCWLLEHILTHAESTYTGIDNWSLPVPKYDPIAIERRARANLASFGDKVDLIHGDSRTVLREPRWKFETFDIIYIDGDHRAFACLEDSILAWPLLKPGGVMMWDDYRMRRSHNTVKLAVDSFLACYSGCYTLLFQNRQVGVRKIRT